MESNANSNSQERIPLTLEEVKVLKECRTNSIYYRGLPVATISILLMKAAENYGLLKKRSLLFYAGVFSFGFFSGVSSYRKTCIEKLMALENSALADQYREISRRYGLPVKEKVTEFTADSIVPAQKTSYNEDDSYLKSRSSEKKSRWEEIREASKQNSRGGTSYDDLKKSSASTVVPSFDSSYAEVPYDQTSNERDNFHPANKLTGKNIGQVSRRTNSYGDDIE